MARKFTVSILLISLLLLSGCQVKNEAAQSFHPYQKITQTVQMPQAINPDWTEQIKSQLTGDYGLSEVAAEKAIRESEFESCRLEYGASHEYEGRQYPYIFKANLIIWKSASYYAICDISDKTLEPFDDTIKLTVEDPKEPWTEDITLLKVVPIDQAVKLTMGGRASFAGDGEEKIGPFTLVQTFYISAPGF